METNTAQTKQTVQNKTTLVQSLFITLGQEMMWPAYSTMLLSPHVTTDKSQRRSEMGLINTTTVTGFQSYGALHITDRNCVPVPHHKAFINLTCETEQQSATESCHMSVMSCHHTNMTGDTDLLCHKHSVVEKLSLKHWMNKVQKRSEVFLAVAERHNDGHSMTCRARCWLPRASDIKFCVPQFHLTN